MERAFSGLSQLHIEWGAVSQMYLSRDQPYLKRPLYSGEFMPNISHDENAVILVRVYFLVIPGTS